MTQHYTMHLILNTHWDREWRWSIRETQMRLQEALDALLDMMERDPRFQYFLADSQTAMIDDYLEVRPENRTRLAALVEAGRLQIGPWYTLPATFMVSGESLVRNLLLGHKLSTELGGVTKFAYNVFSWGQISQMPQIYRQFGMDTIMFYRGVDTHDLDKLEFWWDAPDGSRLLAITFGRQYRINFWLLAYRSFKFGREGYSGYDRANGDQGFLVHFGDTYQPELNATVVNQNSIDDYESALGGLAFLRDTVADKSSSSHLAFFQGFDLENPDPSVPDLVDWLNAHIDYGELRISTVSAYADAVKRALAESGAGDSLPVMQREMLDVERISPEYGCLFPGVYSARIPIKQANARAEIGLERWAEPVAVWASLLGYEYPANFIDIAWKRLLQSQQHDGIGGTHVDRVTLSTLERYREVNDINDMVMRKALRHIVAAIDFSQLQENEMGLVVFNPLATERTGVFETVVDMPEQFVDPVYKGGYKLDSALDILDADGQRVPHQIVSQEDMPVKAYLFYGSATTLPVRRFRVLFEGRAPQMGYTTYTVKHRAETDRPKARISTRANTLENEHLRVTIQPDGTLNVLDKASDDTYAGLHYFEDGGDRGGPLYFMPPFNDTLYTTVGERAEVTLVRNGPLMATYRITWEWQLPAELQAASKLYPTQGGRWAEAGPVTRSERKVIERIIAELSLRKGSRVLEFHTVIDNQAKDHRLHVVFPTGIDATHSTADTPFDVVQRPIAVPDGSGWREAPLTTFPSHSFVDVNDDKRGLALFHIGLPEYEVLDTPERPLALTLLRCWGTPAGAETYHEEPLAQLSGEQRFQYGLYIHPGDWQSGCVPEKAVQFRTPVRIAQTTHHMGTSIDPLPATHSFFTLEDKALIVSALKQSEDGNAIVIRCYNPTQQTLETVLHTAQTVNHAEKVTLEENKLADLAVRNGRHIPLRVKAGEIVSLRLKLTLRNACSPHRPDGIR